MKELEKKYKVKTLPEGIKGEVKKILQSYLYHDGITAVRKRKTEENDKTEYFYTIKTKAKITQNNTMNEIETTISKEQYEKLKPLVDTNEIDKTRMIIALDKGLKAEVDIFHRFI